MHVHLPSAEYIAPLWKRLYKSLKSGQDGAPNVEGDAVGTLGALTVDPNALHTLAERLNAAGDQVTGLGPNQQVDTGSPVLSAALATFGTGWQAAAKASSEDLHELGALVGAAATVYRHTEDRTAGTFVVPER
jgi:hypothetical protein